MTNSGTVTVGSPSSTGSTGTIDAVFATLNLGSLFNIGDPSSGTAGTVDVSNNMTANGGTLNVGGNGGSGGTLDVNTIGSSATVLVNTGGEIEVKTSGAFSGSTTVAGGEIKADNINDTQGAPVTLSGPGLVSGTGKLSAGINASFTFAPGSSWTIGLGNPVGSALNDGNFYIQGKLTVNTSLNPDGDLFLDSGGSIAGSGNLEIGREFTWDGSSILGPSGGTTVLSSGDFKTVGPGTNIYELASNLTNESAFTDLGGSGSLKLDAGVIFDNAVGTVEIELPSIVDAGIMGGNGLFENTGGTGSILDFTAPSSTPTVISANFTNLGILEVSGSSAATLAPSFGATDQLDGSLSLEGDLTIHGVVTSPTGLVQNAGGGKLLIGDGTTAGSLALTQGAVLGGEVELSGDGTLTSGGTVYDNGTLTLDLGAVTSLSSYQQSASAVLALQAAMDPMPTSSTLTVTGNAQLSGILTMDFLDGYTPTSGTVFTVLAAGSIGAGFDSTPPDMTATYYPTSVTLTQN